MNIGHVMAVLDGVETQFIRDTVLDTAPDAGTGEPGAKGLRMVVASGAFGPGRPARDAVPSGIVDPLTSRELEVLEMLAAGRSNQAIAGELVVTLDTVKKHVGHVLGKLGAANRTEAVARARELNLL